MKKYKSYKDIGIVDGRPKQIIVDGHRKTINKYPSKEELKSVAKWNFRYNDTNTCDRCGRNFDNVGWGNPLREYDKERNFIGWDCITCWQKYDSNSQRNLIKSVANCRTGNLNPNCSTAKGNNCEELTYRWLGAKRLSIECDKYSRLSLDHSHIPDGISIKIGDKLVDLSGKIPQTKGKWYDSYYQTWSIGDLEREWRKTFDVIICYCASRDGKTIDRIYIIPFKKEIKDKRTGVNIYKYQNNPKTRFWYEQYRITDEEIIKKVNDIWTQIRKT